MLCGDKEGVDVHVYSVLVAQSFLTLCNPMDCSLPGFSVHGILQARILESVAMPPPPGGIPNPQIEPKSLMCPALAGGFPATSDTWGAYKHQCVCVCVCVCIPDSLCYTETNTTLQRN